MWASLKADMSEFVTTVKTETAEKLNVLDAGLDDVNDEHNDASGAMIDLGTGNLIIDNDDSEQNNNDASHVSSASSSASSSTLPNKNKMLQYLQSCEAVFQDPLSEEEQANIMADFNLDDKTQEISQLLEDNPQTLQATFIQLTSEVEYADFWKRYYCRLGGEDEKKIEATFAKYYEEPEPGPSALSSVTNFFGVAVARLVDEEETEEAIAPNPFFNRTGKASAKSALGFLTGGGRPPFVLNTAVSDDDDEEYVGGQQQQEESEDEEDLGWDEDSDDEEDGHDNDYNDSIDDDDGSEVVMEFKDTEKEALKEKLEQAMEERKQLQNTIQMQAAEIKELQVKGTEGSDGGGGGGEEQAEASASAVPAAEGASAPDEAFKKDLEDLKVELFEREAEVAGLKLKMEDNNLENMHQQEEVAEQVQAHWEEKVKTIASLQAQVDALKQNAGNADDALLVQSQHENQQLQKTLADTKQLLQEQESKYTESAQALDKAQAENHQLNDEVTSLKNQFVTLQNNLEAATASASQGDGLQGELLQTKQEVSLLQQEAIATKSQLEGLQKDYEKLSSELEGSQSKVTQNLEQAKSLLQEAAASAAQVDTVTREKEALASQLEDAKTQQASLEQELQATKTPLQQTQVELETKTHSPADASQSTGIKVDSADPEPTVEATRSDGRVDRDDWGDDW